MMLQSEYAAALDFGSIDTSVVSCIAHGLVPSCCSTPGQLQQS